MGGFPLVVSFYTVNSIYEVEVQNLIASCDHFSIDYLIEPITSFGSWELNCAYKPFFIYEKLRVCKKSLLWIDADGKFLQKPSFISAFKGDFAVRINKDLPLTHPSRIISSTIFVQYNANGLQIVKRWIEKTTKQILDPNRKEEFWDQISLNEALQSIDFPAKINGIPLPYAKIFDHPIDCKLVQNPIIEHYQASRRIKRSI
ncbi:MAG: hypothetical protein L0207_03105 [Chlamydiae bacterium]|nr:hypothetical protein [Chlamydiota bacterium]